jgi:hypothetical protein
MEIKETDSAYIQKNKKYVCQDNKKVYNYHKVTYYITTNTCGGSRRRRGPEPTSHTAEQEGRMDKKHGEELLALARRIYEAGEKELDDYIEKTYGVVTEDTVEQQMEDFMVVSTEVSACLLGNAFVFLKPEERDKKLVEYMNRVRTIIEYNDMQNGKETPGDLLN